MSEGHSHWIKLLVSLWFCDSLNFLESKSAVGPNVHQHLFTDKRATSKHTNVSRKQIMCLFLLNEAIVFDSQVCDEWCYVGVRLRQLQVLWVTEDYITWGGFKKEQKIRNTELVRKGMFFRIRKKTQHIFKSWEILQISHNSENRHKVLLTAWQTPITHFFPYNFWLQMLCLPFHMTTIL